MATPKGVRLGGRQKGTPNKDNSDLLAFWDEKDFCPAKKIIEKILAPSTQLSDKEIVDTCLRLMKFKFSEKKAIEHSVSDETVGKILSVEEYLKTL